MRSCHVDWLRGRLVDLLHVHLELLEIDGERPEEECCRDDCGVFRDDFVVDIGVSRVDHSSDGEASEVGIGKDLLEEPWSFVGQGDSLWPILSQVAHDDVDGNGDADGCDEGGSLGQLEVDALAIDAGHEEPIGGKPDGSEEYHLVGAFGDWQAVDPPLDEEQFQEVDKEWVHHAHSEDDGVGVFHGWLEDGGVLDFGGGPLHRWRLTQMARDPRVRMVAVRIIPGTFMAPILSLISQLIKNLYI